MQSSLGLWYTWKKKKLKKLRLSMDGAHGLENILSLSLQLLIPTMFQVLNRALTSI